ncbi:MAG: hypothetical protein ACRDGR_06005, partial [bacterium]
MRSRVAIAALVAIAGTALADPVDIPSESIQAAVESAFRHGAPRDARVTIVSVPALRHEGGEAVLDVSLPHDVDRPGPCEVEVSCRSADRVVSRGVASVVIRRTLPVWISVRDLRRDAPLDLSALRREAREFDHAAPRLFHPEPGTRFRVMRDVPAGAVLEVRDVCRILDHEGTATGPTAVSVPAGGPAR